MLLPFLVLTLVVPPAPDARVSDYAGLLAADARARLEQRLAERERATGAQMAIAIFPGLEGESLEDFSIRLAQRWRIGRKGLDNGVILVVFVRDRKVRMEVGYGLEGLVPDSVAAQIIREALGPRFREQRYAAGLEAAVDAVFARIALERDVGIWRQRQKDAEQTALFHTVAFILIGGAIVLGLAREVMRPRGGYTARGRGWGSSGSGGPWFGGGGSSGGGSSDSGFSGGGGGFGGGGASGDW